MAALANLSPSLPTRSGVARVARRLKKNNNRSCKSRKSNRSSTSRVSLTPAGWPDADEPLAVFTRTSAHALRPHTISITVSRPAAAHLTFAPHRLPAPHHAYTELEAGF